MPGQGPQPFLRVLVTLVVGLVIGTILAVTWLGIVGFAVGALSALLYALGDGLGAGGFRRRTTSMDDKRDSLRAQLAKPRWNHTDAEEYDEEAWERVRERRASGRGSS